MLSLSPRYDLIRFQLPKTFIPEDVEQKYTEALNTDAYTLNNAIDYASLFRIIPTDKFEYISIIDIITE